MDLKPITQEIVVILFSALILGLAVSFPGTSILLSGTIYFIIIISINLLAKKIIAHKFEANLKLKFWSVYQYGFAKGSHFFKPLPMIWLPLFFAFISRGFFTWMAITEFEVNPRSEKVSKRHGLYSFSEMTDSEIASIAIAGIFANLILSIISYIIGLELLAKLNIYYAVWSLIPLSGLDGTKILFGDKGKWFLMLVITVIFLGYSLVIV